MARAGLALLEVLEDHISEVGKHYEELKVWAGSIGPFRRLCRGQASAYPGPSNEKPGPGDDPLRGRPGVLPQIWLCQSWPGPAFLKAKYLLHC